VVTPMTTRPMFRAVALAAALLAVACNRPGPAPASPALAEHAEAVTGDPSCTGPGVHERHVALFRCDACHPTGASFGFDAPFTFTRGTTTAGGTIVRTAGQATTCTVACHFPNGAAAKAVSWATPGPLACTACHDTSRLPGTHAPMPANATRQDCQACHLLTGHTDGVVQASGHAPAWSDPASPGFHAFSANQGLLACQACHGADLSGGTSGRSCASCHDANLPAGVTSWTRDCVMCHGGTNDGSGAPPAATWGNGADPVRTGAHAAHVAGGPLAPPADCALCHVKPADAFAVGHLDPGPAEVAFAGLAASGVTPSWDRAAASCASTYCHGGRLAGGTNTAPVWTRVGLGEAACGTCHGLPPPAPHPAASGLTSCATCHPDTMTAAGAVIAPAAGGKHLDGIVEAAGGGHGAGWLVTTSPAFHAYAANEGLASCQSCHGAALDGVGGSATTSCASCHGAGWRSSCTGCHGGTNDTSGAPPRATWGNAGDPVRVGAHESHLRAGPVSAAVACTACHTRPTDALSPGHVGAGTADLVFSGLAATGGATPSWSRATATCASTYCHGDYAGEYRYLAYNWDLGIYEERLFAYVGGRATPGWLDGPSTCASCHGNPPATGGWHDARHGQVAADRACQTCHPGAASSATVPPYITNTALHVNGTVEVQPRWDSRCYNCH